MTDAAAWRNRFGQAVGPPLPDWRPRSRPARRTIQGRCCRLEPLEAERHAGALHRALSADRDDRHWTYLPYGPFADAADYRAWVEQAEGACDPIFFAVAGTRDGRPIGVASYLRIAPEAGSVEVGHLRFSSALQRTTASTEAIFLMLREAFDGLGYRRVEWKCDSLNAPSLAAARRLGFRFEGTFRNHLVIKGRSRDSSWLSITDEEWPVVGRALEDWLSPENFDAAGLQRRSLASFRPVD